jgi:hypothetical protein
MNLSGSKKLLRSLNRGTDLKMTDTAKKTIKGMKCNRASQLNFFSGFVIKLIYRKRRGPYVKDTKGNEYISITVEFRRANINSMHIRKTQAASSLLATVAGFLVEISKPAKNDWEIPI